MVYGEKTLSGSYYGSVRPNTDFGILADLAMERHNLFADRPLDDFVAFARHVVNAINRATEGIAPERIRQSR